MRTGTCFHKQLLLLLFVTLLPCVSVANGSIKYRARVSGAPNRGLRADLQDISLTFTLRNSPPRTFAQLRRRAEQDVPSMMAVLKSEGYYGATVETEISTNKDPVLVTFEVNPGEVYTFRELEVIYEPSDPDQPAPGPVRLGIKRDEPAVTSDVVKEETGILKDLSGQGYPFAKLLGRDVEFDDDRHAVDIRFRVDPGPREKYGPLHITGLTSLEESYIRNLVPWEEGQRYDGREVTDLEKDLLLSGLFATVTVKPGRARDSDGSLPIEIQAIERKHRTIRLGVNYRSDEGYGAGTSWEHRNLFGGGESIKFEGYISEIEYGQRTTFTKPHFLRRKQQLRLKFEVGEERPNAYISRAAQGGAMLTREITRVFALGAGAAYKYSEVDQFSSQETYSYVFFPIAMDWDTRNDVLDPYSGGRVYLETAPYTDFVKTDVNYWKSVAEGRLYWRVFGMRAFVLAGRVLGGSIVGTDLPDVPADERFYAGGGGSVRGYEYQTVGPLLDGTPTGGKSVYENSFELRVRQNSKLGYVAFLDGGAAFADTLWDSNESLRWGVGLGLRFFTAVGPLRIDGAAPLNRREDIDDSFQIYISLGQAF